MIKPDEQPKYMESLFYASIKKITRCLIEIQLHTMTRPTEAAMAKCAEVDFDKLIRVIPADRNPNNHTSTEIGNMTLRRIGYKGRLVAHGLRALASTTFNEQGFDAELIEVSLAHVDKYTLSAAYNRAAISNDAESSRAGGVNIFQHRLRPTTTQTYAF